MGSIPRSGRSSGGGGWEGAAFPAHATREDSGLPASQARACPPCPSLGPQVFKQPGPVQAPGDPVQTSSELRDPRLGWGLGASPGEHGGSGPGTLAAHSLTVLRGEPDPAAGAPGSERTASRPRAPGGPAPPPSSRDSRRAAPAENRVKGGPTPPAARGGTRSLPPPPRRLPRRTAVPYSVAPTRSQAPELRSARRAGRAQQTAAGWPWAAAH